MKISMLRYIACEQWMLVAPAVLTLLLASTVARATDDGRGIRSVYAETRTAPVIGNAAYLSGPLRNPVNDASDVAELLTQRSFVRRSSCRRGDLGGCASLLRMGRQTSADGGRMGEGRAGNGW